MEHTLVLVLWSKCSRKALPVFSPLPLPWFITNIKFMFPCTSRVERTINKTTLFTLSKPDSAQLICSSSRCHHHSVPVSLSSVYSNLDCFYARPCCYICPKCSFVRYSLPWWGYSNCDSIFCIWSRCPTQPSECRLSRVTLLYLESIV